MKILDANTVTVVIAVVAIVSPILTAVINNCFQLKSKKIEIEEEHRQDTVNYQRIIFEDYLRQAAYRVKGTKNNIEDKYQEVYALALLYAPEEIQSQMVKIDTLSSNQYQLFEANENFIKLIPQIKQYIEKL